MTGGDITVNYGNIVVKVIGTGGESSIVAGDSLVITFRNEQLICLGFDFVGFFQKLLSNRRWKLICGSSHKLE